MNVAHYFRSRREQAGLYGGIADLIRPDLAQLARERSFIIEEQSPSSGCRIYANDRPGSSITGGSSLSSGSSGSRIIPGYRMQR